MAATQLHVGEYVQHPAPGPHQTWVTQAANYRYAPYSVAAQPPRYKFHNPQHDQPSPHTPNAGPPAQMPTPSPPYHRPYQNGEQDRPGPSDQQQGSATAESSLFVQGYLSGSPATTTILTSPFDAAPSVPVSQPVAVGSPLMNDVENQEDTGVCKDESPTESNCPASSQGSTPRIGPPLAPHTHNYGGGMVHVNGHYRAIHPKDVFERVQGRFSLLGSSNKYNVTIGEIKRRINPPECLNTSLLGGLLRRGKGKNGGNDLRKKLERCGLVLPPGRRKATSVSMLTSLVESEAQDLSLQFSKVCQAVFPAGELARNVAAAKEPYLQRPGLRQSEQRDIKAALLLVGELRELLEHYIAQEESDRDTTQDVPMTGLRSFSLITHSFGVPTISGVLATLQNYLSSLLKYTSGVPVGEDGMYRTPAHGGHHYPSLHSHQYVHQHH